MEENLNDKLIPLTNASQEDVNNALKGQPETVSKDLTQSTASFDNDVTLDGDLFADIAFKNKDGYIQTFNDQDGYLGFDVDPLMDRTFVSGLDKGSTFDDPNRLYDKSQEAQGIFEKAFNGTVQFAGDTVLNIGQGIGGTFYGLGKALATRDFTNFYDNEVTNALDRAEQYWGKTFEIKTGGNQGAGKQVANFIFNDFFGGMSFLVGAVATEAILSAASVATLGATAPAQAAATAGLVARGARILKNIGHGSKRIISGRYFDDALNSRYLRGQRAMGLADDAPTALGKTATRAEASAGILNTANQINRINRINTSGRVARQLLTGAGMEASMESRHSLHQAVDNYKHEYEKVHGEGSFTPEMEEKTREEYSKYSDMLFLPHFALVGISNMLMFPRIFGVKLGGQLGKLRMRDTASMSKAGQRRLAKRLGVSADKLPQYIEQRGMFDLRTYGFGKHTNLGKLARGTAIARRGAYEGAVEEGLQGVFNRTYLSYIKHKYNPENVDANMQLLDHIGSGVMGSYGTWEGQKEILVGTMLGIMGAPFVRSTTDSEGKKKLEFVLMGGYGEVVNDIRARDQRIDRLLSHHAEHGNVMTHLEAELQNAAVQHGLAKDLDAAVLAGDFKLAKDIEQNQIFSHAASKIITGRYDDALHEARTILNDMTAEEYRQLLGEDGMSFSEEELAQRKEQVFANYKQRMEAAKKAFDQASSIAYASNVEVQQAIANMLYNIDVYDIREKQLADVLAQNISALSGDQILSGSRIQAELNLAEADIKKMLDIREKIRRIEKGLQTKLDRKIIKNVDPEKASARQSETAKAQEEIERLREAEVKLTDAFYSRRKVQGEYTYDRTEFTERIDALIDMHEALSAIDLADAQLDIPKIGQTVKDLFEISQDRIALINLHNEILEPGGFNAFVQSIEDSVQAIANIDARMAQRQKNRDEEDDTPAIDEDSADVEVDVEIGEEDESDNFFDEEAEAAAEEAAQDDNSVYDEADDEQSEITVPEGTTATNNNSNSNNSKNTTTENRNETRESEENRESQSTSDSSSRRTLLFDAYLVDVNGVRPTATAAMRDIAVNGTKGMLFKATQISGDSILIEVVERDGRATLPETLMTISVNQFRQRFGVVEAGLALGGGYFFKLEIQPQDEYGSGPNVQYTDREGNKVGGPVTVADRLSDPKNQIVDVVYTLPPSADGSTPRSFFSALTGKDLSNAEDSEVMDFLTDEVTGIKYRNGKFPSGKTYLVVRDARTGKLVWSAIKGKQIGVQRAQFVLRALDTVNVASGARTLEQVKMTKEEYDNNVKVLEDNFDVDFTQEGAQMQTEIRKVFSAFTSEKLFDNKLNTRAWQASNAQGQIKLQLWVNEKTGAILDVHPSGINPEQQATNADGPVFNQAGKPVKVKSKWSTENPQDRQQLEILLGQLRFSAVIGNNERLRGGKGLPVGFVLEDTADGGMKMSVNVVDPYDYVAYAWNFTDRAPIEIESRGEKKIYASRLTTVTIVDVDQESKQETPPSKTGTSTTDTGKPKSSYTADEESEDEGLDIETGVVEDDTESDETVEREEETDEAEAEDDVDVYNEEDEDDYDAYDDEQSRIDFSPRGSKPIRGRKLRPMERAARSLRVPKLTVKETEEAVNVMVGIAAKLVQNHSVSKRRDSRITLSYLRREIHKALTGSKNRASIIPLEKLNNLAENGKTERVRKNARRQLAAIDALLKTTDAGEYSRTFDAAFLLAAQRFILGTHGLLKLGAGSLEDLEQAYKEIVDMSEDDRQQEDLSMKQFEDGFSFTIDPKATQGVLLRRALMGIQYTQADSFTSTFLGINKFISHNTISGILNQELQGVDANWTSVRERLESSVKQYPYIQSILNALDLKRLPPKTDVRYEAMRNNVLQVRQQFVVYAAKDATTYVSTKFKLVRGSYGTTYLFSSNERNMGAHALENFLSKLITNNFYKYDSKGSPIVNKEKFKAFVAELDKITESTDSVATKADKISRLFQRELKMNVPAHIFDDAVRGMDGVISELNVGGKEIEESAFGALRSIMREAASDEFDATQNIMALPKTQNFKQFFFLSASQGENLIQNSSRDAKGNTRWHYVQPKFLTDRLRFLSKGMNDSDYEELKNHSIAESQNILYRYYEMGGSIRQSIQVDYFDSHNRLRSSVTPKEWLKMSPGDRRLSELILYGNDNTFITQGGKRIMLSRFVLPTIESKQTMPLVQLPSLSVKVRTNAMTQRNGESVAKQNVPIADLRMQDFVDVKAFYMENIKQLVDVELDRIANIQEGNLDRLPTEAQREATQIIMFPQLNTLLTQHNIGTTAGREGFHEKASKIIAKELNNDMQDSLRKLEDAGVFEVTEQDTNEEFMDPGTGEFRTKTYKKGTMKELNFFNTSHLLAKGDATGKSSLDFMANHLGIDPANVDKHSKFKLFLTYHAKYIAESRAAKGSIIQYTVGDPGVYWKGNVRKSINNMQKRFAGLIAPGSVVPIVTKENMPGVPGVGSNGNRFVTRIVLEDHEANAQHLAELKKILSPEALAAYKNITTTDAAEFITPRERLLNLLGEGRISPKQFVGLLRKAEAGEQLSAAESAWFSPGKPVASGMDGNHHFYVKSAEFVLLPSEIKGTSLERLYNFMTDPRVNVGRATHRSAYKVGLRTDSTLSIYDKNGVVREFTEEDYAAVESGQKRYVQSRQTFRRQQEVPTKDSIEAIHGTQMAKLNHINLRDLEGFDNYKGTLDDFKVDGKLTGSQLNSVYMAARGIELRAKRAKFNKKYGVGTKQYKERMAERLRKEAVDRGYDINEVAALYFDEETGQFAVPLWGTASASRIDSLMLAIINEEIIKPRIVGFSGAISPEPGLNVLTLEQVKKSDIHWIVDKEGKPQWDGKRLKTSTKDQVDEIILPWKFQAKIGQFLDENGNVRMDQLDDQLLDVFGYRLPTQSKASSSSFRIVGFSRPEMGDRIIVAQELVGRIGQDYDIDKLYGFMYNHGTVKIGNEPVRLVKTASLSASEVDSWADVDYNNLSLEEVENLILKAQNTAIDVYHSSHRNPNPEVQKIIQEPIGDGYAAELAELVDGKQGIALDPTGTAYNDYTSNDASAALDALGVFASQNSMHGVINGNGLDIYLATGNYYDVVQIGRSKSQMITYKGQGIKDYRLAKMGKNDIIDDEFVLQGENYKPLAGTIGNQFNRLMNHAVDNGNNGLLGALRISRVSYPIWVMLTHHGYNQETIELVMTSTMMKDIVKTSQSRGSMSGGYYNLEADLYNREKELTLQLLQNFTKVNLAELQVLGETDALKEAIKEAQKAYGQWRRDNDVRYDVNKDWLVSDFQGFKLGKIEQLVYDRGIVRLFQKVIQQNDKVMQFNATLRRDTKFPKHREELNMMLQQTKDFYTPNGSLRHAMGLGSPGGIYSSVALGFGDWIKVRELSAKADRIGRERGRDSRAFKNALKAVRQFREQEADRLKHEILQNTHVGQLADMVMELEADGVYSLDNEHIDRTFTYQTATAYFADQPLGAQRLHQWLRGLRSYHFAKLAEKIDGQRTAGEMRQDFMVDDKNNLARRIAEMKSTRPSLARNPFLNHLVLNTDKDVHGYYTIEFTGDRNLNVTAQEVLSGMMSMLQSTREDIRQLAKDIVLYSLVTGGNLGSRSFSKYVVSEFLEENGIRQEMMNAVDKDSFFWSTAAHKQIVYHNQELIPRSEFGFHDKKYENPEDIRDMTRIGFKRGDQEDGDLDPTLRFGFVRDAQTRRPYEIGEFLEQKDGYFYYAVKRIVKPKGDFLHKEYGSDFKAEVEIERKRKDSTDPGNDAEQAPDDSEMGREDPAVFDQALDELDDSNADLSASDDFDIDDEDLDKYDDEQSRIDYSPRRSTRVRVPTKPSSVQAFIEGKRGKLNPVLERFALMESLMPEENRVRIEYISQDRASYYDAEKHTIYTRADVSEQTFTHELVHAYSTWAVRSRDPRVKLQLVRLEELRKELASESGIKGMGLSWQDFQRFNRGYRIFRRVELEGLTYEKMDYAQKDAYDFFMDEANQDKFYGLINIQELMAETLSNPVFAEQLSKVWTGQGMVTSRKQGTTVWNKILQLASDMLEAIGVSFGESAATEIASLSAQIMSLRARDMGASVKNLRKTAPKATPGQQTRLFKPGKDVKNVDAMVAYKKIRIKELRAVRAKYAGNNSVLRSIDQRIALEQTDVQALTDDSVSADTVLLMVERELDDIDQILYRIGDAQAITSGLLTSLRSAETVLKFYSRFGKNVKLSRANRERVRNLVGRAQGMKDDYLEIVADTLRKYARGQYKGTPTEGQIKDDSFEVMDSISALRANLLGAGRQGRIELSMLDDVIKSQYADQQIDYTQRVEAYDTLSAAMKNTKFFKKYGWEGLMELDADGRPTASIISPLSGKWSSEEHKRRQVALGLKTEQGWKDYYNWLLENTGRIDVERLYSFDVREVTRKEDPVYMRELEKRFGKLGARELLARQDVLIERYVDARQAAFDVIDMELPGKANKEANLNRKRAWVNQNSPASHYGYYEKGVERPANAQNKYLYHMPLPKVNGKDSEFYDARFQELQQEEDALAFYNFIRSQFKEMMAQLPFDLYKDNVHLINQGLFLPAMRKQLKLNMLRPRELAKKQYGKFVGSITSTDQELEARMIDPVTGDVRRDIPVHFLQPLRDRTQQDYDLDNVFKKFTMMATMYIAKNKVEDIVRLTETALANTGVAVTSSKGNRMLNKLTGDAYVRSSSDARANIIKAASASINEFYGQSKSINEKYLVGAKRPRTPEEKAEAQRLKNLIRDTKDRLKSGDINEADANVIIDRAQTQLDEVGSQVDLAKMFRGLTKWTQARGMGWNLQAGVTNYIYGSLSVYQHAARRKDFDERDADKAFAVMLHQSLHTLTLRSGLTQTATARKIQNMMLRLDVLKDFTEVQYDPTDEKTTFERIVEKFGVYEVQRSSEYFTYGHATIAQLLGTKVGEQSLWELMDENGIIQAEGYRPGEEKYNALLAKINQVNMAIHGNYDPRSPIALKQTMLGPALMQFKSWLPEAVAQEYGSKVYDIHLQRETMGMLPAIWGEKGAFIKQLPKMAIPILRRHMTLNFEDPMVEEQARRAYAKMYQFMMLMIFYNFLMGAKDDEEDEGWKQRLTFAMNIASRLQNDMLYLFDPRSATKLADGMPTLETLSDIFDFADATYETAMGDPTIPTGIYAGRSRMLHHGGKIWPAGNAYLRFERGLNVDPPK